jgi:hypothetical protein
VSLVPVDRYEEMKQNDRKIISWGGGEGIRHIQVQNQTAELT